MNAVTEQFMDSDTQDVSKTLLIGLAGTTGGGKTETAMRIAHGLVGPDGTFSVIDTEHKRALNKKSRYRFAHLDMQPPYTPEHFKELIERSVKAGHRAVVVDSFSAEWDDEGGLHDIATANIERITKGDASKADAVTGLAWKDPKVRHRALMRYIRKLDVPIIFCLRAEPKIKYVKEYDERKQREVTKVVDAGWLPITEKLFGYDMLVYALMMPDNPGVPVHLKKLEPDFAPMFPLGKQVTEDAGQRLAAWASGAPKESAGGQATTSTGAVSTKPAPPVDPVITEQQEGAILDLLTAHGVETRELLTHGSFQSIGVIPARLFTRVCTWIADRGGVRTKASKTNHSA